MARTLSRLIALAPALVGASSTSAMAWWDRCNCQPSAFYPLPPAYVYDHPGGPSWSANGWSYPPVGVYYPVTIVPAPAFAPPPGIRVPVRGVQPLVQPLK